ncbi:MAG: DUF4193 family protein [Acidimicrobiia bacterium]
MSDEEFEDAEDDAPDEDLDEEDLDEEDLDDDALDDDIDVVDLDEALDPDVIPVVDGEAVVAAVVAVPEPKSDDDEEEDGLDLDEELHPDDVEAPLDALLKEKTAAATMEDEEEEVEEEEVELDDRGEGPTKIMPRRPGEFLCSSCFLVLPRTQLADEPRMLCRDCA